jgi:hypothetical protein
LSERRGRRGLTWLALAAVLAVLLGAAVTRAEVTATHDTLITFDSQIFPRVLPRHGEAPIGIRIEGHLKTRKKREPAALTDMELAIQRAGRLTHRGLPICDVDLIDPASTAQAVAACPGARIGYGRIRAQASFPGTQAFYFNGKVVIFNGRLEDGRPAVLLHVFNPTPPTSFVFPLTISHQRGRYGTALSAHVKIGQWSRITDFRLVLKRTYLYKGRRHSYLSAGCPAPAGFSVGISPFVQATLGFADGTETKVPVISSCKVAP